MLNYCLNSKVEKTLNGIQQSGFIGLGVDPIYIETVFSRNHRRRAGSRLIALSHVANSRQLALLNLTSTLSSSIHETFEKCILVVENRRKISSPRVFAEGKINLDELVVPHHA
jgi:hypothetical protein